MVVKRTDPRLTEWPIEDSRWPTRCAYCGMSFDLRWDYSQMIYETMYRWVGTDIQLTISEAPPGAMWDASWLQEDYPPGPDGKRIQVRLPDRVDWQVDRCPSDDEKREGKEGLIWSRTGEVPVLTVTPSVISGNGWRGALTDGFLIDMEGIEESEDGSDIEVDVIEDDDDIGEVED